LILLNGTNQTAGAESNTGRQQFEKCGILLCLSDIDLKVASKFFGTKFACGSSVTGDDEIVIQGDVKDELFDIIPEKWPEVSKM